MIRIIAILGFFLLFSCTEKEGKGIYNKNFDKKYPDAKNITWEIDDHGYHEAKFEMDGEKYRADFDGEGNWIETERNIKYKNLPEAVKKTIEEQYDKDDVEEVELVDHPTKGTFYDVELKQDGKKFDVEVAANGRVIGIEEQRIPNSLETHILKIEKV